MGIRLQSPAGFLSSVEPDPQNFTISTIDPTASLFKDVDLPGGDLTSRPAQIGGNAQQCRLACIDQGRCVAFTYIKRKKECWLKGVVGSPKYRAGLVTGIKDVKSFSAAKIISPATECFTVSLQMRLNIGSPGGMAERVGFEPTIPLQVCRISSAVRSTTLPPLRICWSAPSARGGS